MAIQYSGNANTSTFTPATKQDIINSVGAALIAAGWTPVSGGSGTTAWKLQSATTPQGYAIRVLMQDNGGSCITFSLESTDGTLIGPNSLTQGGAFLIPGGYTYRIACSKYQVFIWATPNPGTARTFAAFGTPFVESWLTSMISRVGWMQGNAISDTDTTLRASFRTTLGTLSGLIGPQQAMLNAVLWTHCSTSGGVLQGQIVVQTFYTVIGNAEPSAYRYINDAAVPLDALIFWGLTDATVEGKSPGQLWDAFVSTAPIGGDQTAAAPDGHNYIVLTDNNAGSSSLMGGTLLLAIS